MKFNKYLFLSVLTQIWSLFPVAMQIQQDARPVVDKVFSKVDRSNWKKMTLEQLAVEACEKVVVDDINGKKILFFEDIVAVAAKMIFLRQGLVGDFVDCGSLHPTKSFACITLACFCIFLFCIYLTEREVTLQASMQSSMHLPDSFFVGVVSGTFSLFIGLFTYIFYKFNSAGEDLKKILCQIIIPVLFDAFAKGYEISSRNRTLALRLKVLFDSKDLDFSFRPDVAKARLDVKNNPFLHIDCVTIIVNCLELMKKNPRGYGFLGVNYKF